MNRGQILARLLSSPKTRIPFREEKWNMSVVLAPCSLLQHRQTFPTYLIVENDADERAVNVHATAVVLNEAELSEPVHEEADARTRGADHLSEGFLADFRDDRYRLGFLAKVSQQQ